MKLQELKTANVDFVMVSDILDELIEDMNFHFETEEDLMKLAGASDIEKHVQQHDLFRNKLTEFRKINGTKSHLLSNLNLELMFNFLQNWLVKHSYKFNSLYVIPVQKYIAATGDAQKQSRQ